MVETIQVTRIKCGQIFILSTENFSLVCDFCEDDFYTFDDLRAHLSEHFPDLPTNLKDEDNNDCELTQLDINEDNTDNLSDNLQDNDETNVFDEGSTNVSSDIEIEIFKIEHIAENQERSPTKRSYMLHNNSDNENEKISNPLAEPRYTLRKREKKSVPLAFSHQEQRLEANEESNILVEHPTSEIVEARKLTDFKCDYCQKEFTKKETIRQHMFLHSGIKPYKCSNCSKTFAQPSGKYHHERVCLKRMANYTKYNITANSKPKATKELKSTKVSKLSRVSRVSTATKDFKAKNGLRATRNSKASRKSVVSKARTVSKAPKVSAATKDLKATKHSKKLKYIQAKPKLNVAHSMTKRFECRFCHKLLVNAAGLINHENTHMGRRPHKCHICLKTFTAKSNLMDHNRVHANPRGDTCRVCRRHFSNSSSLRVHIRTKHLSDNDPCRYFNCQLCNIKFKSPYELLRHQKMIHRKNTDFTCDLCRKQFTWKHQLIVHMRVHSGVRPYKCSNCPKRFRHGYTKVKHERLCI